MEELHAEPRARFDVRYAQALAAYDAVLVPTADLIRKLEWAGADYAISPDGERRLLADVTAAENVGNFERAALLAQCVSKGRMRRAAGIQVRQLLSDTAEDQSPAPVGMRSWRADDPIWPNADMTDDALRHTHLVGDHMDLGKRTFRAAFARQWRACFVGPAGEPIKPDSDAMGWDWRRSAVQKATKDVFGAQLILVSDVRPGMVVYNGQRIVRVEKTSEGLPMQMTGLGGTRQEVRAFHFAYHDGAVDGPLPASTPFALLPHLDLSS